MACSYCDGNPPQAMVCIACGGPMVARSRLDAAVQAEREAIVRWLRAHGLRWAADEIERGEHVPRERTP